MSAIPPHAIWPNDLHVPLADFGDLVGALTEDMQEVIGMDALKAYKWKKGMAQNGHQNLRNEIKKGKSLVILTGAGEVERVVSVVALRVERPDDHIFVQLAKWEEPVGLTVAV